MLGFAAAADKHGRRILLLSSSFLTNTHTLHTFGLGYL